MNPYPPQQQPLRQWPAQQFPALPTVRQYPVQQRPALPQPRLPQRPWPQPMLQQPPVLRQLPARQRAPHPALIIAFGVLVAALVVTTVLLVRGSSAPQPVRSAFTPPTPPVVLSTTAPVTTSPRTTAPTTTQPTTTEPTTTEPTTSKPTTSKPTTSKSTTTEPTTSGSTTSAGGGAAILRGARTAAQAWASAVNAGDADGVLAHSCRQDVEVYGNGKFTNPGRLRGTYTFKIQKIVALTGTRTAAVARFTISPDLGSMSTLDSYVTQQSGRWLVCISVTKRADL